MMSEIGCEMPGVYHGIQPFWAKYVPLRVRTGPGRRPFDKGVDTDGWHQLVWAASVLAGLAG